MWITFHGQLIEFKIESEKVDQCLLSKNKGIVKKMRGTAFVKFWKSKYWKRKLLLGLGDEAWSLIFVQCPDPSFLYREKMAGPSSEEECFF